MMIRNFQVYFLQWKYKTLHQLTATLGSFQLEFSQSLTKFKILRKSSWKIILTLLEKKMEKKSKFLIRNWELVKQKCNQTVTKISMEGLILALINLHDPWLYHQLLWEIVEKEQTKVFKRKVDLINFEHLSLAYKHIIFPSKPTGRCRRTFMGRRNKIMKQTRKKLF